MSDATGAVSRLGCITFVSIPESNEKFPVVRECDIVSAMHGSNHESSRYNSFPQYYCGYVLFNN